MIAIASAAVVPFHFDLRRSVGNARHVWAAREGVLLRLEADGKVGWGEASPLPGYSPDTLDDATADLERVRATLDRIEDGAVEAMLERASARIGPIAPSATFALETALIDLRARIEGRPAWQLLAPGRVPAALPFGTLVSGATTPACVGEAEAAVRRGLAYVKMKVGSGTVAGDVMRVEAVRAAVGASIAVRLDANGTFSVAEAAAALGAFAPAAPDLFEEPVSGELWRALVSERTESIPLAIDETLASAAGRAVAHDLLRRRQVAAVVVKPATIGGFLAALRLARLASEAGAAVVVTHMFDGPIATAAAAMLALALDNPLPAGLDVVGYASFALGDAHPIGATHLHATNAPGLGAVPGALVGGPS